jgi:uncharacterized membrane-anchored protein
VTHRVSVTVELNDPDLIARAVELLTRTAVGISLEGVEGVRRSLPRHRRRRGGRRMNVLLWLLIALVFIAVIVVLARHL